MGEPSSGAGSVAERYSRPIATTNMWLGGMFDCISSALNRISGASSSGYANSWEVPYDAIESIGYLGSGAQGIVFGGKFNGELVAVKKVHDKNDTDVKHLRKLNHINIVKFHGVCTVPPNFCLVMEYCQYGSLFDFIHSESNLEPTQIMIWAKDVALGMSYLHSFNIIHRDLKSPNLLISDDLVIKVSDFGTSREWENASTVLSFKGTAAWMAPEIIRNEQCTAKVDVWSFGVVLWEMMTKNIPYKDFESQAVIWGVGTNTLSLPIPTGCPASIKFLMSEAWQPIYKNRPPFKIMAAHIDMAAPDIEAMDTEKFAAKQKEWSEEVCEKMEKLYARNEIASEATEVDLMPRGEPRGEARGEARQAKQAYEQKINYANQIFLEACTVRLQLEQREKDLKEREKLLKACPSGPRKSIKFQRQQSSTSSGTPQCKLKQKAKEPAHMLVNYIDKDKGKTHTVAVKKCICAENIRNNNIAEVHKEMGFKETTIEWNGNVEINAGHKLVLENPEISVV